MGSSGVLPRELGSSGRVTDPLSSEELELQREVSDASRRDLEYVVKLFVDELRCKNENTALMLSGGAESSALLWVLLSLGIRPKVISFPGHTEKGSLDFRRAKHLASRHGLEFHPFAPSFEPDDFCTHAISMMSDYGLTSRPDMEVSYLYRAAFRKASELGAVNLFAGIGEGNQYSLGRRPEIAGRQGRSSVVWRTELHSQTMQNEQPLALSQLAAESGVNLALPMIPWGSILNFAHLPFRVINMPRNKAAFIQAFRPEAEADEFCVRVSPMQTGDGSSADLIERAVKTSPVAREFIARHGGDPDERTSTSQLWYNSLKDILGVESSARLALTTDFRHNQVRRDWSAWLFTGAPLPASALNKGATKEYSIPRPDSIERDDVSLFDLHDEGEGEEQDWVSNEDDYSPDSLSYTDCFGAPLANESAMFSCPRARAGICTRAKHYSFPFDSRVCQVERDAADYGLLAIYRLASFHYLYGSRAMSSALISAYEYSARRNQEIIGAGTAELSDRYGVIQFGDGLKVGELLDRDGVPLPAVGVFESLPATATMPKIDRSVFASELEENFA